MSDPVFVLLKQSFGWIPEAQGANILGAIVKNYLSPTDAYEPEAPLNYNKRPLLSATFDNFALSVDEQQATSRSLSFRGLFTLKGQKADLNSLTLRGRRIVLRRLQQHPKFWACMLAEEKSITSTARQWISETKTSLGQRSGEVFWVTGLLLCQDVTIAATEADAREREAQGEVPIGTVADLAAKSLGVPISLQNLPNIVGERSSATENSRCFAASSEGTQIFALQLQRVLLKKGQLVTKDEPPKISRDRQLGEEGRIADDDLTTIPLDEEAWEKLLDEEQERC